jgi:hypothetical protein
VYLHMKNNPIRKMHVGWNHTWTSGVNATTPKSIREWVAVCPKCNVVGRVKSKHWRGGPGKNTRKAAKDALHYHMRAFH